MSEGEGEGDRGWWSINNVYTRRTEYTKDSENWSSRVCSFEGNAVDKYLLFRKHCKSGNLINKCAAFSLVEWRYIHLNTELKLKHHKEIK